MAKMNSDTLLKGDYLLQENLLSPTTYNIPVCVSPLASSWICPCGWPQCLVEAISMLVKTQQRRKKHKLKSPVKSLEVLSQCPDSMSAHVLKVIAHCTYT